MKKLTSILILGALTLTLFSGCKAKEDNKTIKVGASPAPHAEILKAAAPELEKLGYTLEIVEFVDYVQPNLALNTGDIDANYFQHQPYLDDFNEKNKTELSTVATVHFEPFAIYGGKTKSLSELADGATVGVPNDTTNEARALQLLEAAGLIKLKEGVGLLATAKDIVENPKNLKIEEVEAATLPRLLSSLDIAAINGNYAIEAGLSVGSDALFSEDKSSDGAETFANVLVVKTGNEDTESTKALVEAINSDTVRKFINDTYDGGAVPTF